MKRTLILPAGETGDVDLSWDTADKASVELAAAIFDLIREKHAGAHIVGVVKGKPTLLKEFNPDAEGQLLLIPVIRGG